MSQYAGPTHAATLPFAHATPDAELLTVGDREFEALAADHAASANLFGLPSRRAPLWEEQLRVDAHAVSATLPGSIEATFEQCLECHLRRPLP